MKQRTVRMITLGLALAGAACVSPQVSRPIVVACEAPRPVERSGPALVGQAYGMQATPVPVDSVQFDSYGTASLVAIQQTFAERTNADTVRLQARFVSCSDAPAQVRVRTAFLKRGFAPAEPPTAWQTMYLEPRALAHYEVLSTAFDVTNYVIEIARQ